VTELCFITFFLLFCREFVYLLSSCCVDKFVVKEHVEYWGLCFYILDPVSHIWSRYYYYASEWPRQVQWLASFLYLLTLLLSGNVWLYFIYDLLYVYYYMFLLYVCVGETTWRHSAVDFGWWSDAVQVFLWLHSSSNLVLGCFRLWNEWLYRKATARLVCTCDSIGTGGFPLMQCSNVVVDVQNRLIQTGLINSLQILPLYSLQ